MTNDTDPIELFRVALEAAEEAELLRTAAAWAKAHSTSVLATKAAREQFAITFHKGAKT